MLGKLLAWLNGAGVSHEASAYVTVTNEIPGTTLHVGDGRVLGHGESVTVLPELADVLVRHNDQAPSGL